MQLKIKVANHDAVGAVQSKLIQSDLLYKSSKCNKSLRNTSLLFSFDFYGHILQLSFHGSILQLPMMTHVRSFYQSIVP